MTLYGIKRVGCQYISGCIWSWKRDGMEELVNQMKDFIAFKLDETTIKTFPHQIALECNPPYRCSSAKWIYEKRR